MRGTAPAVQTLIAGSISAGYSPTGRLRGRAGADLVMVASRSHAYVDGREEFHDLRVCAALLSAVHPHFRHGICLRALKVRVLNSRAITNCLTSAAPRRRPGDERGADRRGDDGCTERVWPDAVST
jgi:hypothetical protein